MVVVQCQTDTALTFCCSGIHSSLGLLGWRLFQGLTLLSPFSHLSLSLIGLLASMDVWQQKLTLINRRSSLWEKGNLFCCCKIQGFVFCSLETGDYLPERKLISQQHTDPHDDFLQQGHAFGGYLQLQFGLHIQDRLRQHWVVHTDEETTKFQDQFFF